MYVECLYVEWNKFLTLSTISDYNTLCEYEIGLKNNRMSLRRKCSAGYRMHAEIKNILPYNKCGQKIIQAKDKYRQKTVQAKDKYRQKIIQAKNKYRQKII